MPATAVGNAKASPPKRQQFFAKELIAHQHPGHQQTKHHIDQCSDQRSAKGKAIGRHDTWASDSIPKLIPCECERFEHQRRQWNENNQTEVHQGVPQGDLEAGQNSGGRPALGSGRRCGTREHELLNGVKLVEIAAIVEVHFALQRKSQTLHSQ